MFETVYKNVSTVVVLGEKTIGGLVIGPVEMIQNLFFFTFTEKNV